MNLFFSPMLPYLTIIPDELCMECIFFTILESLRRSLGRSKGLRMVEGLPPAGELRRRERVDQCLDDLVHENQYASYKDLSSAAMQLCIVVLIKEMSTRETGIR